MSKAAKFIPAQPPDLRQCVLLVALCLTWVAPASAAETRDYCLPVILPAENVLGRLAAGERVRSAEELELSASSCLLLGDFPQGNYELTLQCQLRGPGPLALVLYPRCAPQASGCGVEGPELSLPVARPTVRTRRGVARRDTPIRPWQNVRLVVEGRLATLWSEGQLRSRLELSGPQRGWVAIGARGCGGTIAISRAELVEVGFTSLFDGSSLTGWEGADSAAIRCWKAADECLQCTGDEGSWLRSQQTWTNFELRLEYRVLPGGNSGVYVRVPADGNHHGAGSGVEVQILDDASPRYRDLKPYQFSASLYAIEPAEPGTALPAGQWNALGIRCVDRHYQITHNGRLVLDRTEQQCPELVQRLASGYLGLQNHSEQVWFRRLRIQTLP